MWLYFTVPMAVASILRHFGVKMAHATCPQMGNHPFWVVPGNRIATGQKKRENTTRQGFLKLL